MSARRSSTSARAPRDAQPTPSGPAPPPPNPFAAYDARYWQRSEITPANFATKGDLAFYTLKTDLSNYQTRGNYAFATEFANYQTRGNYQMAGDYVLRSDLAGYQTIGNYQLAGQSASFGDFNASNGYFRSFGPQNVGGTIGNSNPDGDVGAVVGANINNSWIWHAPNDSRNTLFIAPGTKGTNWNWGKQMTIDKNGNVGLNGALTVSGKNILNEIGNLKTAINMMSYPTLANPVVSINAKRANPLDGFAGTPTYISNGGLNNMPYFDLPGSIGLALSKASLPFNIQKNGGFTAMIIGRMTGTPTSWENVFNFGTGNQNNTLGLYRGDGNTVNNLFFEARNGTTWVGGGPGVPIVQNTWFVIGIRYNITNNKLDIFKDNRLVGSATLPAVISDRVIGGFVGRAPAGGNLSKMQLSALYMYDRYLTDTDFNTLYNILTE